MRLEIITPIETCIDAPVRRIVAEAPEGHFGILPHHGDFVSELVPGILVYAPQGGPDRFVALQSGILVKCGAHVRVAVQSAVEGDDPVWLAGRVARDFRRQDEDEREARAALARLEAGMIRRFRELEGLGS